MQRDFHPRGQASMDRVLQDGVQRVCTETARPAARRAGQAPRGRPDEDHRLSRSGSLMGDWKRGEKHRAERPRHDVDDEPGAPAGGSCYNCHQLSPQELSYGTIGPSLHGFGKMRGNGAETQRYVYGKIYNAKAYNACSQMPRLGASGTLTEQQIKDLVGAAARSRLARSTSRVGAGRGSPRIPPASRARRRGRREPAPAVGAAQAAAELYDVPPFGNVSLLHITDVHAQLLPMYFREPSVNRRWRRQAAAPRRRRFLKRSASRRQRAAHAFTHLDFEALRRRYGKVGGFAHLATLVKRLRASRPQRAAARRRRQLAGLGDRALDAAAPT